MFYFINDESFMNYLYYNIISHFYIIYILIKKIKK